MSAHCDHHHADEASAGNNPRYRHNDAIGNLAVMLAALGVFGTQSAWPDLAVAAVMAALAIAGGAAVLSQARREVKLARPAATQS
jgi:Co/Zn/Cd efflux system component